MRPDAGEKVEMPSSTVLTFTDPDDYFAAVRTAEVEGVVTARGNYRAELTHIGLIRLFMQRGEDSLPRVVNVAANSQRIGIHFATDPNQPASYFGGMELSQGDIIVAGLGSEHHLRSTGANRWGDVALTREELIAAGHTIIGRELTLPTFGHPIRPPAPVLSRLRNLHEAAGHLAKTAPDILAKPEVGRAMDQALAEAMVACLASGNPVGERSAYRHHTAVMRRLEQVLQVNSEGPLYTAELSAAVGVSYRTLHDCCREHLGMSPKRYLWLRRMHLARRALRRADSETTSVTEVATNYGFWELGCFSVAYRSLFGGSPSTTLRRPPEDPKPGENVGLPWEFAKSA